MKRNWVSNIRNTTVFHTRNYNICHIFSYNLLFTYSMLFLYSIIYFIPVLPIIIRQSVLSCLIMMSTLFADVAFTYILIRFFSVIYNLLLFLVNRFRLLFFTRIIVDKHGVKIVPQTIDKKYILNRLFSMNQNIYKRNTNFNLNWLYWNFVPNNI